MSSLVTIRHHTEAHELAEQLGQSEAELNALDRFLVTATDTEVEKELSRLREMTASTEQPQ